MICLRIEMWPKGDHTKKYDLAAIVISNEGGNANTADYQYAISHQINTDRGKYWTGYEQFVKEVFSIGTSPNIWKKGIVEGFYRKDGVVKLISQVLKKAKL